MQTIKGVTLRAVIQSGSTNSTAVFSVDGNKLVAKLAAPLAARAIVVIAGKDEHGHAVTARYVVN